MYVDHNGFPLVAGLRFGPDVQTQAVLAHRDAWIGDGCEDLAANVGDTVRFDQLLGEFGIIGADVGRKACRPLGSQ